jgi:hypothetical protein
MPNVDAFRLNTTAMPLSRLSVALPRGIGDGAAVEIVGRRVTSDGDRLGSELGDDVAGARVGVGEGGALGCGEGGPEGTDDGTDEVADVAGLLMSTEATTTARLFNVCDKPTGNLDPVTSLDFSRPAEAAGTLMTTVLARRRDSKMRTITNFESMPSDVANSDAIVVE